MKQINDSQTRAGEETLSGGGCDCTSCSCDCQNDNCRCDQFACNCGCQA